jgi:hypothetical protein
MELQEIYFIAEIAAAIAVIGSLIFVGVQLRQSTAATVVGNSQAMVQVRTTLAMALATNSELAALQQQGLHPDVREAIGPKPGQNQIGVWIMATFRSTEVWFLQWRDGQLSDELWQGNRAALKGFFRSHQSVSDYWATSRDVFAPGFQREVDEMQREAIEERNLWLAQVASGESQKTPG